MIDNLHLANVKGVVIFMMGLLLLAPATSFACSYPEQVGEKPSMKEVAEKALFSGSEFLGVVKVLATNTDESHKIHYDLKVLKQYAGTRQEILRAYEDIGNSCSFLFKVGDETLLKIDAGQGQPYAILAPSNYFSNVPKKDIESYLDNKQTSGGF